MDERLARPVTTLTPAHQVSAGSGPALSILLACAPQFAREATYTFDTLLTALGLSWLAVDNAGDGPGPLLVYGQIEDTAPGRPTLQIEAGGAEFFARRQAFPPASPRFLQAGDDGVPVLFCTPEAPERLDVESLVSRWRARPADDPCSLPYDLIASAFYFLSRWEEWHNDVRDDRGRYPYEASLYHRLGGLYPPPVDGYLHVLRACLSFLMAEAYAPVPAWPPGYVFALGLTHDIDQLFKWTWGGVKKETKESLHDVTGGRVGQGLLRLAEMGNSLLRKQNPFWNLAEIAGQEQAKGAGSSFYFLADDRHPMDSRYSLDNAAVQALFQQLQEQGREIGLHGGFASFDNPEVLADQLAHLRRYVPAVCGVRQHHLRFDSRRTPLVHEALGFLYDTTLAFARQPGYRSGFSFPFYPYHVTERRPLQVLELPLAIMDVSLAAPSMLALAPEQARAYADRWLAYVTRTGSLLTLLWHNQSFDPRERPGYGQIYWQLLDRALEAGAWAAGGREIARRWIDRRTRLQQGE